MNTPIIKRDTADTSTDRRFVIVHHVGDGEAVFTAEIFYMGRVPTFAAPLTDEEKLACVYEDEETAQAIADKLNEMLDIIDPARSFEIQQEEFLVYSAPLAMVEMFLHTGSDARYMYPNEYWMDETEDGESIPM